ncbi:MAG TPA: hypothetical protein VFA76_10645 [Terriglobales bacterium]|nr:hypothetical protein [Terriglobales bacterium]
MKLPKWIWRAQLASLLVVVCCMISCGAVTNICDCLPVAPDISDYRHRAKHVPLPNATAQEITVATIFSWHQTPVLPPEAPRFGRENQLFHVANAFLQNASVNPSDCDVHLEISAVADRKAPRVVVETPVDGEYCAARKRIQSDLAQRGFKLDVQHGGDLPQAMPAEVLGMAFEDFEHGRGSPQVATLWELHPAIVTLK